MVENLNFDTEASFDAWREGGLVKPLWEDFTKHFLQSSSFEKGKKVTEFEHVYRKIIDGEKHGQRLFSNNKRRAEYSTAMEWHAWLLYQLVAENTLDRNGCFYQAGLDHLTRYRAMWHLIAFQKRQRSRQRTAAAKGKKSTVATSRPEVTDSSDEERSEDHVDMDPTKGIIQVNWGEGMPDEVEEAGEIGRRVFHNFCGYTEASFYQAIEHEFDLAACRQKIKSLTTSTGRSFLGMQLLALQSAIKVSMVLTTENCEHPTEEGKAIPAPELPATNEVSEATDREDRLLLYQDMVSEASHEDAKQLDMKFRLWKFNMMRAVASADSEVIMRDIVLRFSSDDQTEEAVAHNEEETLQVGCSHRLSPRSANHVLSILMNFTSSIASFRI